VDIDQLGMCYPEPVGDPGRHRMQLRNLCAVVANFAAAGASCVVVSGVTDAVEALPALPGLVVCRLRADRQELTGRYTARGYRLEELDQVLREADTLDAFDGLCVDTTGLTVDQAVERVADAVGDWRSPPGPRSEILLLCGATGSGKSTVGFMVYLKALQAGRTAAFVDLEQIGMSPSGGHALKAANLAAVWRTFQAAGARVLVAVGPVEDEAAFAFYTKALAGETVTLCRLHAGPDDLTTRIMSRGEGGGWDQPGDPLRGLPPDALRRAAALAAAEAQALERKGIGHHRVDTTGLQAGQAADLVAAACGWPA
jgi:hypothetical protein